MTPASGNLESGSHAHDVAVVGAGAAGLAAAAVLRAAGRSCILIEAGDRIGGRAHTVRPDCLGGARFDTGATWLHQADRNPLVRLAHAHGVELVPAHQGPHRLFVPDCAASGDNDPGARSFEVGSTSSVNRPRQNERLDHDRVNLTRSWSRASEEEVRDYDAAYADWERAVHRRAEGPDIALAEAAGPTGGPWTASIENWEGAIIAAADADVLGLHDWQRNLLGEGDLSPPDGVGALLARLLGPMAGPVQFATAVEAIDWSGPDGCTLRTARGVITARAAIVTVSTGVLRAGRIRFTPALPPATLAAIEGLPMGLLSKLALPATGTDRLGLDEETLLERRLPRRGTGGMLLSAWPSGLPYVAGFFGGRQAWALAGRPADALAEARAILCRLLGPAAGGAVDMKSGFVTRWAEDPLFGGAYAYCPPGKADARARLAEPVGDGRLLFAGEACRSDGLAGTVGGALADGERAAGLVLRCRFGVESAPSLLDGFPYAPEPV